MEVVNGKGSIRSEAVDGGEAWLHTAKSTTGTARKDEIPIFCSMDFSHRWMDSHFIQFSL